MSYYLGPNGVRMGEITIIKSDPEKELTYETIERKGIGHPDSIADSLASLISRNYSRYTISHCDGMILHHQIDKLMIIGGKSDITFSKGRMVEPIRIIVAGRASSSYLRTEIPVERIIQQTIRTYFNDMFPLINVDHDILIENRLTNYAGPGTITQSQGAIANMFNPIDKDAVRGYEKVIANDTSYCIAYAPLSRLEQAVLRIEGFLNSRETKNSYPWLGSDIKIMAVRNFECLNVTMCIPQIANYVHSLSEYKKNLEVIGNIIHTMFVTDFDSNNMSISINTKDDYESANVYLTVAGSSLAGDIGVVGRGNRINGLITSNRPMSLEGTSGKNPRYYSGFIYAMVTRNIAQKLFCELGKACIVEIVSQNGGPLANPWQTRVIIDFDDTEIIKKIIHSELSNISTITQDFVSGNITTC